MDLSEGQENEYDRLFMSYTKYKHISGVFSGLDTVIKGQTVVFSFTINRSGSNAGGGVGYCNTALGSLATGPGASYLKLQNGELTHRSPLNLSSGSLYGTVQLYCTSSSRNRFIMDQRSRWIFKRLELGIGKKIAVRNLVGIK
ncbi:MAG: hypothetical protein IPM38_16435 [Ignavibacteria bacterium]|nr:hypothetical protein [Ignavibacteria bacterium]